MTSRFLTPLQPASPARAGTDPFFELHREMNRLFDDFLGGGAAPGGAQLMVAPRLDVRENPNEICVCAELPGVRPEDVDLRIEGNLLTLRGEKHQERENKQEDYHMMERSFGRFQRSLQLPYAPDPNQVHAQFEHGVLTVHVPKQPEQERSRRIEVQALGPQEAHQPQVHAPGTGAGTEAGAGASPDATGASRSHH